MPDRVDSRHWSPRWLRCAHSGTDAVVMYDLYQALEIQGCGRGRCEDLKGQAATTGARFRVTRFWGMETCSNCSRPYGIARADETFYLGDSEAHALSVYAAVEASFFESSESA